MSTDTKSPPAKLLHSRADVLAMLGVGNTALKGWIASGRFPKPDVMLGTKAAWKIATVQRWIDSGGTKGKGA